MLAVLSGETDLVDIHDLEFPAEPFRSASDQRERPLAEVAGGPSEKADGGHQESVIVARPMRPATVLAILLLLLVLTVAGVVFVIQLLSAT